MTFIFFERSANLLNNNINLNNRYKNLINALEKLITTLDIPQLLKKIQSLIYQELNPTSCLILIKKANDSSYEIFNFAQKEDLTFSRSIVNEVLNNARPKLFYSNDYPNIALSKSIAGLKIISAICVPIISPLNKDILGALYIDSRSNNKIYSDNDLIYAEHLAYISAMALENAFLYEKAIKDNLTDLYSKNFFMIRLNEEFKRANRFNLKLLLMLIDIDNFKYINDKLGHLTGDKALKLIASKLRENIRSYDIIARFGGDEFIILFPELALSESKIIANKIIDTINKEKFLPEQDYTLTISIGIACYPLENVSKPEELIERADIALYKAKEKGKNQYFIYNSISNIDCEIPIGDNAQISNKPVNGVNAFNANLKNLEGFNNTLVQAYRLIKDSNEEFLSLKKHLINYRFDNFYNTEVNETEIINLINDIIELKKILVDKIQLLLKISDEANK